MLGDIAERVPNIKYEYDCAMQVRNMYPEAIGATWYMEQQPWRCYAEFGGRIITHSSTFSHGSQTCRFQGSLLRLFLNKATMQ